MQLKDTKTLANLKAAFEAEAAAGVMYRWSAQQADVEGQPDVAKRFEAMAEAKVGQALGHLEYLAYVGDPASGEVVGDAVENLAAAASAESSKSADMYPGFAAMAREEGLDEIAEWFESVATADEGHAAKFTAQRDDL